MSTNTILVVEDEVSIQNVIRTYLENESFQVVCVDNGREALESAREILRPLNQIARSSQRIASGHYSERVAVPASTELAMVATNFNQMAEALEQVEQQRVALISNVMHELRTPLTGLEGYLEGLMDGLFGNNPETFAQMSQEVRRLHLLVDDLQALSRVEAGQISLQLESFDLIPLVERVTGQLKSQAMDNCLELTTAHAEAQAFVQADAAAAATQTPLNDYPQSARVTFTNRRVRAAGSSRELIFLVPPDLPAGDYRLEVHSLFGQEVRSGKLNKTLTVA